MPASPQFLFIAKASLGTCAQPPRVPQNKKSISIILGVSLTTFNVVDKSGAAVFFYLVKISYWDPNVVPCVEWICCRRGSLAGLAPALVLWCRSTRWELAMMCTSLTEPIDRLWELFEFTAAAAAVYDHTPQRLGRRVPDP